MFAALLIARTRTLLWIALLVGLSFGALELVVAPRLAAPFAVKCIGVSLIIAALVLLRLPWALRHALLVALVVVGAAYLLTAISGIVSPSREYATTAVLFVAGALATATLLPWGLWPQMATVLFGSALLCAAAIWGGGDLQMFADDPAAAVGITFILSIATAYELQRYRLASMRELAARQRAELEIRALNAALERRVAERTDELQAVNAQLRALSARLEAVREEERTRVAQEIHDELGQMLTALKIDLDLLPKRIGGADAGPAAALLQKKLAAMSELAHTMIYSVRRICTELRPSVLDDLGLAAAVEWQAREFQRRCGIRCTFTCEPHTIAPDPTCSIVLFRIVQEALTNVARHARATSTSISLREDEDDLVLEIHDDGRGVTEAEVRSPQSLGLLGIRERARLLGGEVEFCGVPGRGTTLRVRIPHGEAEPAVAAPAWGSECGLSKPR